MSGEYGAHTALYGKTDPSASGGTAYAFFRVLRRLTEHVRPYPLWLVMGGLFIEQLQILFFSFSPTFLYVLPFFQQLAYAVAFFSAPLSDGSFGPVPYIAYTAILCSCAAASLVIFVTFHVAVVFHHISEKRWFLILLRAAMETIAGWLFFPLMHLYLGGMMCRNGDLQTDGRSYVYNFSGEDALCSGSMRTANVVLGSLGLFSTFAISIIMCWVFEFHPDSRHPKSRPHSYVDMLSVVVRTLMVILYHCLVNLADKRGIFSVLVLVMNLVQLGVTSFVMPYYNLWVGSLHGAVFAVAAYMNIINTFADYNFMGISHASPGVKSMVVFSVAPFVACLGWSLAQVRVHATLLSYMSLLRDYGVVPEHVASVPLPRSHRRSAWYTDSPVALAVLRELKQEMIMEEYIANRSAGIGVPDESDAGDLGNEGDSCEQRGVSPQQGSTAHSGFTPYVPAGVSKNAGPQYPPGIGGRSCLHQFELFIPFIARVHIPTDVELATRFLRAYEESTGDTVQLSSAQLGYVLRLYMESLSYFTHSPHVTVSLAAFLFQYCDRAEAVIDLMDELVSRLGGTLRGVDLMTKYKLYRLWYAAKESLGYRDSAHLVALQRARMYHRQALSTTMRFWNTLLTYKVGDQIELIRVSDMLATQRQKALHAYRTALTTSPDDTVTLTGIANFVEEVLGSKEVAQEVRYAIEDIEERKRNRKLRKRGKRTGGVASSGGTGSVYSSGSGSVARTNSLGTSLSDGTLMIRFDDIMTATRMNDTTRNVTHSWERTFFLVLLYVCVLVCCACSVVLLVLDVSHSAVTTRYTKAIQEVNMARALGYKGVYFAGRAGVYYHEHECDKETTVCIAETAYLDLLQGVSEAEMEMRIRNAHVTFGEFSPSFSSTTYKFLTDGLLGLRFTPHDTDGYYFWGTMSASSGEEVSLYALLRAQLASVAVPQSMWTAMTLVSGYFTELVNRLRHASMTHHHYLQFLTDSGVDVFLDGYQSFARTLTIDVMAQRSLTETGLILALVIMLVAAIMGGVSFYINVYWIAKNRVLLVGVFSFIPNLFLEELRDEMTDRLDRFDKVQTASEDRHGSTASYGEESGTERLGRLTNGESEERPHSADRASTATRMSELSGDAQDNHLFIRSFLSLTPSRSCLRKRAPRSMRSAQVGENGGRATVDTRTVRFDLAADDLADKPKPRLLEPVAFVDGSGEEIIAEFEKSLIDMDREARKENEMAQRRHDTTTSDRMLTTTYRLTWCEIKDRLVKWSRTISLFDRLYSGFLIPALLLITVATVGLSIATFKVTESSLPEAKAGLGEMVALYNHVAEFDRLDVEVATFLNFFDPDYARHVADYIFVRGDYNALTQNLQRQHDPSITITTDLVSQLRLATLRPILADAIYCALGARAGHALREFDVKQFPYLTIFFYAHDESDPVFLSSTYPRAFEEPDEYLIPMLSDLPNDAEEMHRRVLEMHRRARFYEDADVIRDSLTTAAGTVKDKIVHAIRTIADRASLYLLAIICLSSVFIAVTIGALVIAIRHNLGKPFYVVLVLALLCSATVLVLSPIHMNMMRRKSVDVGIMQQALESISQFRTSYYRRSADIQHYIHTPLEQTSSVMDSVYANAPEVAQAYLKVVKYYPSAASVVGVLRNTDQALWRVQQVAMYLAYASKEKRAGNTDVTPPSPPFLSTYNFAKEETYENDVKQFGHDHPYLMYSRPENDLLRDADDLVDMARFAVFGLRGAHYFFTGFEAIDDVFNAIALSSRNVMEVKDKKERTIITAILVLSIMAAFFMLVAALLPLLRFVLKIAEGSNRRGLVRAAVNASYWGILRSVLIAAVVFSGIGILQFTLILVPLRVDDDVTAVALNSSARFAGIYRSLARGMYASHALSGNSPPLAVTALNDLVVAVNVLTTTRSYLYFRDGAAKSGFGRLPSLTDDQRALIFGANQDQGESLDARIQSWVAVLNSLVSFKPEIVPGDDVDVNNPLPQDTYHIQPGQREWAKSQVQWLVNNYEGIVDGLTRSDELYRSSIQRSVHASTIPGIVLFVVVCGCTLFMLLVVLPWFRKLVEREEQETRILLRAIPKAALDAVPSISLFMDSGVVEDEVERNQLLASYTLSANVQTFLEEWRKRDPNEVGARSMEELCRTHLELRSDCKSGVVLCDAHGNILFTNSTLLEWTRHDTLVGRNVGVLMPPNVAAVHNQFLYRYMQAPRIGGPRPLDVMAASADGEPLHVIVKKVEAPTLDGTMYFLAELFRYPGTDLNTRRPRRTSATDKDKDATPEPHEKARKQRKRKFTGSGRGRVSRGNNNASSSLHPLTSSVNADNEQSLF